MIADILVGAAGGFLIGFVLAWLAKPDGQKLDVVHAPEGEDRGPNADLWYKRAYFRDESGASVPHWFTQEELQRPKLRAAKYER